MARVSEPKVTRAMRRAGEIVDYLRVSSLDQKELRQLDGLRLDNQFVDKASGKDLHRPGAGTADQVRAIDGIVPSSTELETA